VNLVARNGIFLCPRCRGPVGGRILWTGRPPNIPPEQDRVQRAVAAVRNQSHSRATVWVYECSRGHRYAVSLVAYRLLDRARLTGAA